MVAAIKEICIFVILAQAVLLFVPGSSYMKYVRVLVGMMMILKITEPVFDLFLGEEIEREMAEELRRFEQTMDFNDDVLEAEDYTMGIYESIEEELKNRLNESGSGYEVLDVAITEERMLVVKVADKKEENQHINIEPVRAGEQSREDQGQGEALKKTFESCIGVDAERIRIVFE